MNTNLNTCSVTVDEAAPAEPRIEAQATADLEHQRAKLATTTDQLYVRMQLVALTQETKEEASARFASFRESVSLVLQDATGSNVGTLKKISVVALSAAGAIDVIALLATRSSRHSRREARRVAHKAAAHMLQVLKPDVTEAL